MIDWQIIAEKLAEYLYAYVNLDNVDDDEVLDSLAEYGFIDEDDNWIEN